MSYWNRVQEVDKAPLSDRKEAQAEYGKAMADDPSLVAERIGWLLQGNYGYEEMQAAQRVLKMNKNANKVANLSAMIAVLEWSCPSRGAVAAWKKLTPSQKHAIDVAIKKEIADEEAYIKEQGER